MKFNTRGFTSLFLTLAMLAMSVSGVMLFLTPRGRVANWTGWTLAGLSKEAWASVHMNIALLFVVAGVAHLLFNWTMFWGYIKKRASLGLNLKAEMALATILAAVAIAGAIYEFPPFSTLVALNQQIKDSWEGRAADAPAPHAEEFGLARMAANLDITADEITAALQGSGMTVPSGNASVSQIAAANGVTPQEVHAAILKHLPESAAVGKGNGPGMGRGEHRPGQGQGRGMGRGMGMGRGLGGGWGGQAQGDE